MYLVFPAFRISSSAGIDSSRGVSAGSESVNEICMVVGLPTRINSMEIVEVWSKAEPFDSSLYIFLDVRGRVGDTSITVEDVETTF